MNYKEQWTNGIEHAHLISPKDNSNLFGQRGLKASKARIIYYKLFNDFLNHSSYTFDCDIFEREEWKTFSSDNKLGSSKDIKNYLKKMIFRDIPFFSLFFINIHPSAETQIKSVLLSSEFNTVLFSNINEIKLELRRRHEKRWTRAETDNERQGSVSVLGALSEHLLELACGKLVDNKNFFKSTNTEIKTYGDFVLLALPNNLWLSVKSGYSRERLLASGYFNDVLGVGFFEEAAEFSTEAKIRNFKKVGFLAIYLPDSPVNESQIENETNTYDEVLSSYGEDIPENINGTPFFRRLSELGNDLRRLFEKDITKRTTLNF